MIIELVKGGERQTAFSEEQAGRLGKDGWKRIDELSAKARADLDSKPVAPWRGYDEMSADEIVAELQGAGDDVLDAALAYERAHKKRNKIIQFVSGTE